MLKEKNILRKVSYNQFTNIDVERTINGEIILSKLTNFKIDKLNLDVMIRNNHLKLLLTIPFNIGKKTEYTSYTFLDSYVEEDNRNYELNTLFKIEKPKYNVYVNKFYN
jgi:hypothetical protein